LVARKIGKRLGVTRNAVIGKLYRMGIGGRGDYAATTTMERLQALHDKMDAVLSECAKVRMYLPPRKASAGVADGASRAIPMFGYAGRAGAQ
jgi:hypothetical protein